MTLNRIKFALWLAGALMSGACFGPSAHAYVPPGPQLLQMMQQALGQTAALSVDQRVTVLGADAVAVDGGLAERLKFEFPDRFRSDIDTGSGEVVQIVSGEQRLSVIAGRVVPVVQDRCDVYKDMLLYHASPLLEKRLASLGLDAGLSSLGRLDGRLVYVVGARYPDPGGCQVWLDKETLRPVRWIVPPQGEAWAAGVLDIRYDRWQATGGIWYPWLVFFYQDGVLVRRIDVQRVEVARGFPDGLFDIDRLKHAYHAAVSADRVPPPVEGEIRRAIEDFHRLYRE